MSQCRSISPRNVNSYFAVQSPENQIDKKNLDKSRPYRSCVGPEVRNLNCSVKAPDPAKVRIELFPEYEGVYACCHIAAKVILDSRSNTSGKGKVNLENYNTAEQLQVHLKDITNVAPSEMLQQPTDIDILDNAGLGSYLVKQFKTMNLDTTKILMLCTKRHMMALRLRCKGSEHAKEYVVQLLDPNTTNSSARVNKCDLSSIGSLELKQFMSESLYQLYFPEAGTNVSGELYFIMDDEIRDKKYIHNNSKLEIFELPRFCISEGIAPDVKFSASDIKTIAKIECEHTRSAALCVMVSFHHTDLFKVYVEEVAGLNLPSAEQVKRLQAYGYDYNNYNPDIMRGIPSERFNDYLQVIIDSDHLSNDVKRAFVLNLTEQGEPIFLTGLEKNINLTKIIRDLPEDLFSKSDKQELKENIIYCGEFNGATGLLELMMKRKFFDKVRFYLGVYDELKDEHKYKLLQEKQLSDKTIVDYINHTIGDCKYEFEKHEKIIKDINSVQKGIPIYKDLITEADNKIFYSRMPTFLQKIFNRKKYSDLQRFKQQLKDVNPSFLEDKQRFLGFDNITPSLKSKSNKKTSKKKLEIQIKDLRDLVEKMEEKMEENKGELKKYEPLKPQFPGLKYPSEFLDELDIVMSEINYSLKMLDKKYTGIKNDIESLSLKKSNFSSLCEDWGEICKILCWREGINGEETPV